MLAVRQRAACMVRTTRPTISSLRPAARSYASDHGHDHHHDHHAPEVNESLSTGLLVSLGTIAACTVVYKLSSASKEGEPSDLVKWLDSFRQAELPEWAERNNVRTDILNQAAQDKFLFYGMEKAKGFQLRTPELFHASSPHNIPAGHGVNLDQVTEHYRRQHLEAEERKAKQLAEAKKQ